jgi:hypothetical protein
LRLNPQFFNVEKNLEILGARCTASGGIKFGNISGGFVRIRGALLRRVELSHKHVEEDTHWVLFGADDASMVLDVSCKISEPGILEPVYCLLLGNTARPWEDEHSFALVLREVAKGTFERMGLLRMQASKAWFESATVETITLVGERPCQWFTGVL